MYVIVNINKKDPRDLIAQLTYVETKVTRYDVLILVINTRMSPIFIARWMVFLSKTTITYIVLSSRLNFPSKYVNKACDKGKKLISFIPKWNSEPRLLNSIFSFTRGSLQASINNENPNIILSEVPIRSHPGVYHQPIVLITDNDEEIPIEL